MKKLEIELTNLSDELSKWFADTLRTHVNRMNIDNGLHVGLTINEKPDDDPQHDHLKEPIDGSE